MGDLRGGGEGEAEPRQQVGRQLVGLQPEVHHVREVARREHLSTTRLCLGTTAARLLSAELTRGESHLDTRGGR